MKNICAVCADVFSGFCQGVRLFFVYSSKNNANTRMQQPDKSCIFKSASKLSDHKLYTRLTIEKN
ncbi:hypothetical protein C823_000782 [Eubacterium plexicaudatum ASF492]|nr:hypothetical protein C823_000782 [Eubacterium plexicaudatum ASF492]